MKVIVTAIILSVVGFAHHFCSAQMACNGVVSGMVNSDLMCDGDCVLEDATIAGNVACSTGTLVARGSSSISGNLQVDGSVTSVVLESVTVSGTVDIKDATLLEEVIIEPDAILTTVKIENAPSANIEVSGSLGSLELINTGDLDVDNLMTTGAILVIGGDGMIQICGSTIGGGLSVEGRTGPIDIDINLSDCEPSTLIAGVSIQKGANDVTIVGANLESSDLGVTENSGNVMLSQANVSDVLVENSMGTLTLTDVNADSDISITGHIGDVLVINLNTLGDSLIKEVDGEVMLTDSDLNGEGISIILITQDVTVSNNTNLSVSVEEVQGAVTITDNTIGVAAVNKNTGGVDISNNTISTLDCSDNTPAPTLSENDVLLSQSGQCATL